MGLLAPPPWQPPITERTDRATIAARLRRINAEVIAMRENAWVGVVSEEYKAGHATLNMLLYYWQLAKRWEDNS